MRTGAENYARKTARAGDLVRPPLSPVLRVRCGVSCCASESEEFVAPLNDLGPVGVGDPRSIGVKGGDRRLRLVRTEPVTFQRKLEMTTHSAFHSLTRAPSTMWFTLLFRCRARGLVPLHN